MDAALASRLGAIEQRLAALEAAHGSASALPVLDHGRRPNFWADTDVTELLTRLHRRIPIKRALAIVADTFGAERAPSRSAVHRYWAHLDDLARRPA